MRIDRFGGFRNKGDPTQKFGPDGEFLLDECTNVEIDDGYLPIGPLGHEMWKAGVYLSLYTSADFGRLYAIKADPGLSLVQLDRTGNEAVLMSGLVEGGLWQWTEFEKVIFATDGVNYLRIHPVDGARHWGLPTPPRPEVHPLGGGTLPAGRYRVHVLYRNPATEEESGASEFADVHLEDGQRIEIVDLVPIAGLEIVVCCTSVNAKDAYYAKTAAAGANATVYDGPLEQLVEPMEVGEKTGPPGGDVLATYGGQVCLAQYYPEDDRSVIWKSEPQWPELFDPEADLTALRGRVTMMAGTDAGLIIGTTSRIFIETAEILDVLTSDFGCPPGRHAARDRNGKLYFWTSRGVCSAPPLELHTDARVSVPAGAEANGNVIDLYGFERYMVSTVTGSAPARNPYHPGG